MNVNQPLLEVDQSLNGFVVRRATPMPNLRSIAYELEHQKTGARILHLHNDDSENLFSVTFPTPPPDDTGVPHILEHSVLAGSQKYRVKDPFFEMIKCSMATFINAMTSSDHTAYPVASNVRQDFYNLAEVYWDAVFHPLLTEATFQREGHHLELANKDDPKSDLIIKGIVYNEMKGGRSSPESKVHDLIEKGLWPDTPYGKDSGGDPDHIPELTWQGLRDFHQTFYHPSNAYIFLYGDISTVDHLDFLRERLDGFAKTQVHPNLLPQPRWSQPRIKADVYPVAPNDATAGKTFIVLNWLVGASTDAQEVFALSALERILLGNQAAPLRKALIDSKLGEDLAHSGFWSNGIDTSFHIGLKGSEPNRLEQVTQLILHTLAKIAEEGISKDRFDAAMQQLAYSNLEITPGFPLHLMSAVTSMWQHGADPLAMLHADELLARLKHDFTEDPRLFSRLIQQKLLENPHRLTLVVQPDGEIQGRKDAEFAESMKKRKQAMSPEQIETIRQNQVKLEALLNQPNPPAAVASLPQLHVKDLPRQPRHIPTTVESLPGGGEILNSHVFANGVNYLHLSFDLTGLPMGLYPYLALYSDCVHKMGAAGDDYIAMAQRVSAFTGGVGFGTGISTRVDDAKKTLRQATFTTKFLDDNVDSALSVLRDLVFEMNPRDTHRLKDVLLQSRAAQRSRPSRDGMGIALRHAARGLNLEAFLHEITSGLPLIHFYEQATRENPDALIQRIEQIRAFLLNRARITASFTGSELVYETVRRHLADWTGAMRSEPVVDVTIGFEPFAQPPREGLAAPMNAAYCTMVMPAPHISHPDTPRLAVAARLLSLGYVLDEVRFKGTAYGGGCGYNGSGQVWTFHSYRDPWVNRTLDVYRGALAHVRGAAWTQPEVDRAIIGTAKEGERPIRPPQAAGLALWRHLTGDSPDSRNARHAGLLDVKLADIGRVLTTQFETNSGVASVCVVSSREKLEEANRQRPQTPLEIRDILK
ncbi:MAG: insulinase family protein [Planctomycetota bacterium]|nr:insulinase family protein [Planctomycetota bacterium]